MQVRRLGVPRRQSIRLAPNITWPLAYKQLYAYRAVSHTSSLFKLFTLLFISVLRSCRKQLGGSVWQAVAMRRTSTVFVLLCALALFGAAVHAVRLPRSRSAFACAGCMMASWGTGQETALIPAILVTFRKMKQARHVPASWMSCRTSRMLASCRPLS
jgi:hypothetical protein